MRVTLSLLADFVNFTREDKLNILGIFSDINPTQMPFVLQQMAVVLALDADIADYGKDRVLTIALRNPSDKDVVPPLEAIWSVPHPDPKTRAVAVNHVVGLSTIVFQDPGEYRFLVFVDGNEIHSISMYVNPPEGG